MSWFEDTKPSSPDATTYKDLPPDTDDWGCNDWKIYYQRNKTKYGQSKAIEIVSKDFDNLNFLTNNAQYCRYNCDWVSYFKKEGFTGLSNFISNTYCAVDNVSSVATNITEGAKNITEPGTMGKLLVLGGIGFLAFKYFTNGKK